MDAANLSQQVHMQHQEARLRQRAAMRPPVAQAQFELARFLTENNRGAEALPFAEEAVRLNPRNFQYLYYCGALYMDFRQTEYAIGMLLDSVRLEPRAFLSQHDLAQCYYTLGQGDRAIAHYRAALKLAAGNDERNKARVGLASCLGNSGQTEQAILLYEKVAQESPTTRTHAYCQLARLKKAKPGSELEQQLVILLGDTTLSDEAREELLLALGNLHDGAQNYDRAFQFWQQSRAIALKIVAEHRSLQFRDHGHELQQRKAFFSQSLEAATIAHAHQSEAPMFVAGMPRSGTTLTEQILGSHKLVSAVGEIGHWGPIEAAFYNGYKGDDYIQRISANAARGELKARAEEHLKMMRTIAGKDSTRFVEKTTHVFIWLGYLATIFAKARFLHLLRHPADTFISTYQNQFNRYFTFAYDQVEFAREYAFSIRMMNFWKTRYPERIATFYYETLIAETEAEARRMVAFAGLPWDENCLRFHERKAVVRTFSAQQVRRPIYQTSKEKWRVYEKHLGPLLEELERQGVHYEPGNVSVRD